MKERIDQRWPGGEEWENRSKKSLEEAHVAAVKGIAAQLYRFPTPEYPHLRAFVNEPEPVQKVFTNYGRELAPDIVVLQWPERLLRIVAEVATPDMVTEENARGLWAVEARLEGVQFYLYVPSGMAASTKRLLKGAQIKEKDVALRTWRYLAGQEMVEVVPVR